MKRPVVILLHIGYWLLYLLLLLIIFLSLTMGSHIKGQPLLMNRTFGLFFLVFALFPSVAGFYSFYAVLFSRFLAKKKILFLFLGSIIASIAAGIGGASVLSLLKYYNIGPGIFADGWTSAIPVTIIMCVLALLSGVVGLVMKGFISWYADIKLKEELNKKNYETELALVKSQLDPHFLFNTINNIDVLIEKDAIKASAYLNKLSHIMRFMLYETKTEKISLARELEYIREYIDLQKIRFANANYVQYSVIGAVDGIEITPMLFIPFIENAFKHSANRKMEHAIRIQFTIADGTVAFECSNACSPNEPFAQAFHGLGNELIQKRLALLYSGKHEVSIEDAADLYTIKLQINCQ